MVMQGRDRAVYGKLAAGQIPFLDPEEWSNHPHSITFLLFTMSIFAYAAFHPVDSEADEVQNLKRGVKYASFFFLGYCVTQLRDGHFVRPHPAIWRIVTGIFILYEMFLIVLLFQSGDVAPKMMKHLDPQLGTQLPPRSYGEDCRLYTPDHPTNKFNNLQSTVFDQFVVMHFVGWFIGALMIRDRIVCWSLSIFFEFYEMTFQHWLPNFNECWWDHIILDVLVMNNLGIALGMRVCKFMEMKKYNWVGIQTIPNFTGKAQRAIEQFTPVAWMPYDWAMFRSWSRYWRVLSMLTFLSVMMLNSFFLKTVLWVPASHMFNVYRLMIWYSAGSYAIAEYYIFVTTEGVSKIGPRAWLALAVVFTEVALIVKCRQNHFEAPFPMAVKIAWAIVLLVSTVGAIVYFSFFNRVTEAEEDTRVTSPQGITSSSTPKRSTRKSTRAKADFSTPPRSGVRRSTRNRTPSIKSKQNAALLNL